MNRPDNIIVCGTSIINSPIMKVWRISEVMEDSTHLLVCSPIIAHCRVEREPHKVWQAHKCAEGHNLFIFWTAKGYHVIA